MWRWELCFDPFCAESKMRQISILLATAVITATVAVGGVLAVNPNSPRPGGVVRTSSPVDAIKMMKDARDLPDARPRERRPNDRAAPRGSPRVALSRSRASPFKGP
jgi:hypothetical protein